MTYTIQEAARATGLSQHTLRYYERIGLIGPIARSRNGHRRFSDDDLWWSGFVALTAGTGMPIRRIQRYVALERDGAPDSELLAFLEVERSHLLRDLARLQANLDRLDLKILQYRASA